MDKKNKLNLGAILAICFIFVAGISARAQEVDTVTFCDKKYEKQSDSITLFLKVRDGNDKIVDILGERCKNQLKLVEDDSVIPVSTWNILPVTNGKRIPSDVTFSVLIDLGIPESGKKQICEAIRVLVDSTDSPVFISYFGNLVGPSGLITSNNYTECCDSIIKTDAQGQRCSYSALYSKLTEFTPDSLLTPNGLSLESNIPVNASNYSFIKNPDVSLLSNKENPEKNILFFFTESTYPLPEPKFTLNVFNGIFKSSDYRDYIIPKVYAFVYTPDGTTVDPILENVLSFLGKYTPSDNFNTIIEGFKEAVPSEECDYAFTYKAIKGSYYGKTKFKAFWGDKQVGTGSFDIGIKEKPYQPSSDGPTLGDWITRYLLALLVSLLALLFYIVVMKVLIPGIKSWIFKAKYYKKYEEESGIQTRLCSSCKKPLKKGQIVVTRCKHITCLDCWKENDYHCAEYGQNCKEGVQEHIDIKELFSKKTLRSSYQTIGCICAGLVSWVIFDLLGDGAFGFLARGIVNTFCHNDKLSKECDAKVLVFLYMGLFLAFFLSLVFRYFDGARKKDWKSWLKDMGLSLLSGIIGMASCALGGIILCLLLKDDPNESLDWQYSIPAYLLFSVCTSLSLTIKSSIPAKNALLGGLASAAIGFIVLYITHSSMSSLFDFVIYGGGLGASIVTVRMLAEKYFLIIKNGVNAGQSIPIHKWMNATGGSNTVTIGMTRRCEIQMTWEKSNNVAKEHARLYIDHAKSQAMLKPMAEKVIYNSRAELPVNKAVALSNNDTFTIGDTTFQYVES